MILFLANANIAQAQWPAMSSGYAVTTNWHGIDVPIGEDILAIAGTTDDAVDNVTFKWLDPGGTVRREFDVDISIGYETPIVPSGVPQDIADWADNNQGIIVYYAQDTYEDPDMIGDWAVQAYFNDEDDPIKTLRGKNSDIIAIRATSFNVVPEVPFGTIVISLSMFGTLSAFILKKRHNMN